tara:strand:+ start:229 stop:1152 length:924 start_codon:yes stop_codon:yes gene_type:complete
MKKFLAITPYFGGVSSAPRQTELNNVLKYFEQTYESLKPYMTKLIVSVYNDLDYETVKGFGLNPDVRVIQIPNIDPVFLPANTVRLIQEEGFEEEYVYFTEADQVLYAKDWGNIYKTIDDNKNVYIVPQRFEQIPTEYIQKRIDRYQDTTPHRFVEFDGVFKENDNKYVVANEPVSRETYVNRRGADEEKVIVEQVHDYNEHFYVCPPPNNSWVDSPEYGQAYGAAYLCHRDLFLRVKFIDARFKLVHRGPNGQTMEEIIEFQPTETTAGHDLLRTPNSVCLKSKNFFYFHVDHLSGYEFNKKHGEQ